MHTVHSDGQLTPAQVVAEARAVGLDFIATTEHNTTGAYEDWLRLGDDDLLVILGMEVTTVAGHWLALGVESGQLVDWRYKSGDDALDRSLAGVHRRGGLCVAAHPHAPYATGTFEYPLTNFDVVEVWNGLWRSDRSWNADNDAALADWSRCLPGDLQAGRWRPAMGNSDAHLAGQVGSPQTVVIAEELSTQAILSGLRAGRCWIAESATVDVSFDVTSATATAGVGECVSTRGEPCVIHAEVRGVSGGSVSIHTDRGAQRSAPLSIDGPTELEWITTAGKSAFVRLEVRHPDGQMAALTNPIVIQD